jgi:hypothetical protein
MQRVLRLLPLMLVLTLLDKTQAQFTFTTNNGTITITGYTGSGGAVTVPSTTNGFPITSIGESAFYATSVAHVLIPNSVTNIGDGAFNYCTNLTSVTTGDGIVSIGEEAFNNCASLVSISIPRSVSSIGTNAFVLCASLTAITVDPLNSFYSSLDGVLFDKNQTALIQCPMGKAGSYTIPQGITSIGYCALTYCTNLISMTIPNSVTNIGIGAFDHCTSLTNVTIGTNVTSIEQFAFVECYSLPNITIPNSSTNIGIQAFGYCSNLTSVAIGIGVASIGGSAFCWCTSLTNIAIPNGVTSIGRAAFVGCTTLTAITVNANNSVFSSVDGVLFNKGQTTLIEYPGGKVGGYAVPNSVTSIGATAFAGCTGLTNVTIPSSVTSIQDEAFAGCPSLISITLGNGVTTIGATAFGGCTGLTNVTIPNSVTKIADSAFLFCNNLTGLYFCGNRPIVGPYAFQGGTNMTVYYLPGATGWGFWFYGYQPKLWNPMILSRGIDFADQFGFAITGTTDIPIVVEASTKLASVNWTALQTCTLTNGSVYFSDLQRTNYPARFYRIRSP